MDPQMRFGMIIGAVVGAALAAFFYMNNHFIWDILLIPFAALMGAAPWMLKPKNE
jgi:uncharacterized membrane protein YoaK (UPF0700 family)